MWKENNKFVSKKEYLIKTFSRTKKKDYENYVLNSIWQRLDNLDIKPVTQQYVKRSDNTYALLDLYFPQINIAVECDEEGHRGNLENDILRERDIARMLSSIHSEGIEICRIDVGRDKDINEVNVQIKTVVEKIKEKYENMGSPKWTIEDPVSVAKRHKRISVQDDLNFRTINDVARLFGGRSYASGPRPCTFKLNDDYQVWCPKMAIQTENGLMPGNHRWFNSISDDTNTIYEKYIGNKSITTEQAYYQGGANAFQRAITKKRVVFAYMKNSLGETYYKFIGVFKFSRFENNSAVLVREKDEIDLNLFNL